jgi:hypothetical protein
MSSALQPVASHYTDWAIAAHPSYNPYTRQSLLQLLDSTKSTALSAENAQV